MWRIDGKTESNGGLSRGAPTDMAKTEEMDSPSSLILNYI